MKLPHEPSDESIQQVEVKIINNLHYSHYYIEHTGETNDEHLCRALKLTIDELLNIEGTNELYGRADKKINRVQYYCV